MKKLLVLLNIVQFLTILVLTVPTEADHKRVIAAQSGSEPAVITSDAAVTASGTTASVVADITAEASAKATTVVAAATAEVTSTGTVALATDDVIEPEGPRCDYQNMKLGSICRQNEQIVTVGALFMVVDVRDWSFHRVDKLAK